MLGKKKPQLIGIDVGTRSIKAVLLTPQGKGYQVQACACEMLGLNVLVDREVKDAEAFSNTLRKLKLALKVKKADIATAVSGPAVITKLVYMDKGMTDFELETQIELEADSLIPYPLEQVYLDFESLGDSEASEDKIDVLLTAAHRDLVDARVTLFREVEFEPKVVDVESYAFAKAIALFAKHNDTQQKGIKVGVNLGSQVMTVVAVEGQQVLYSKDHQFGTDVLLQDIAIMNALDKLEAEKQMVANDLPETWRQDSLSPFITNLSQQLGRALQMLSGQIGGVAIEHIQLSGGGACLDGLTEQLSQEMSLEVSVFNPFAEMTFSEQATKQGAERIAPQFAIAAGLAYRGFEPWHI